MGVLRNREGKIVGTIDDGGRGCELVSCKQADATRVRAGCQRAGVVFDGTRSTPMCSRGADYRTKAGCDGAPDQLKRTIDMGMQMRRGGARDVAPYDEDELRAALEDLGLTPEDVEKVVARLNGQGGALPSYGLADPMGSSMDARRRMASDAAIHAQRVMASRRRLYDAGQISGDALMRPISPPAPTAAAQRAFDQRYPHAGRLKR